MSNKKFQAVINELFIRCRKVNISLAVIIQFYFSVPKDVRLNSTHYLTMKISNRKELQNIAINHFVNIYYKPHSFLTIDTTLAASDLLRFRKKLLPSYKNDSGWLDQNLGQKYYAKWSTAWFIQKATKISALSSNNFDKYKYLTG